MSSNRLEAFSDGVIAILITIMVLELRTPEGDTWDALRNVRPVLLAYALSFVYLGIYWSNHHHLFQAVDRVNGKILWANLHLLFWLSLVPFTTRWMGESEAAQVPAAAYGAVLFLAAVAYFLLSWAIILEHGRSSMIARSIGADTRGKLSLLLYASAVGLTFLEPWISIGIYLIVAIMWLVPDRRIESGLAEETDRDRRTG